MLEDIWKQKIAFSPFVMSNDVSNFRALFK